MQESLDALAAFLVVARQKSFTAAAANLGVTPTAVSQLIKRLESRLGVVLFQRTTRRVALTEPGAHLFASLEPAMGQVNDALAALGGFRDRPVGTLRITAPRTASAILARIIGEIGRAAPEVVVEASINDAFVDLVSSGFDAGIRLGDAIERDMVRVPITRATAWAIVGAPAYLDAAGRPKRPEDLTRHRTIRQRFVASGTIYRWELTRGKKTVTVDVAGGAVVDDVDLLVALARDGLGLAYVGEEAITDDVAAGRLERVLERYVTPGPGLCLYFPARMQEQPKMRALIDAVKRVRSVASR